MHQIYSLVALERPFTFIWRGYRTQIKFLETKIKCIYIFRAFRSDELSEIVNMSRLMNRLPVECCFQHMTDFILAISKTISSFIIMLVLYMSSTTFESDFGLILKLERKIGSLKCFSSAWINVPVICLSNVDPFLRRAALLTFSLVFLILQTQKPSKLGQDSSNPRFDLRLFIKTLNTVYKLTL